MQTSLMVHVEELCSLEILFIFLNVAAKFLTIKFFIPAYEWSIFVHFQRESIAILLCFYLYSVGEVLLDLAQ